MRLRQPDADPPAGGSTSALTLHRGLGFWTLTAFGVGDILGAGIYALVGEVAAAAGRFAWVSFLITVFVALLTALSYAELGSRFPRSGGESYFCQQAFGWPALAALVGYMVFASGIVSLATVAHAFSGYLNELTRLAVSKYVLTPLLIAMLAGIAWRGIRQSSAVNVVCTLVEMAGLLFVIVAGCIFLAGERAMPPPLAQQQDWTWVGVMQGGALAFFAFIGFEDMVNVAEEVEQPRRNIPAAILTALFLAAVMYLAVAWVATSVVPPDLLSASTAPLLEVVRRATPAVPDWSFSLIALFAVANTGLLNLVMGSRLLYGMSAQGLLPKSLRAVHWKWKSPHRSIAVVSVVALTLALSGTLRLLAGTTNALLLLVFLTVNLSLIVLRCHEESSHEGFRVPVVAPAIGAATCVGLIAFLPRSALATAASLIAIGALLVTAWEWRKPQRPDANEDLDG